MSAVRVVAAGDSMLLAEFDDRIDPDVNARVLAVAEYVRAQQRPGVRDVVPTFRSVAVHFDPVRTDVDGLMATLAGAAARESTLTQPAGRLLEVPVCYGIDFGPDLGDVARHAGLAVEEVIALHSRDEYRVYMLGFVPGFAYLGRVDPRIAVPRRSTPRPSVPAGSVAIAGEQSGIYPMQLPGGWNIIGRTPLQMFAGERPDASLLHPGDRVRFVPIDRATFDRLAGSGGL